MKKHTISELLDAIEKEKLLLAEIMKRHEDVMTSHRLWIGDCERRINELQQSLRELEALA